MAVGFCEPQFSRLIERFVRLGSDIRVTRINLSFVQVRKVYFSDKPPKVRLIPMENTPVRRVARGSGVGATPGPPSIPPPMTPPVMDGKIDWNQIEVANGLPSQTSLPSSAVHRASHGATGLRPVISTSSDSVTGDWIHSTSKFDETRGVSALTPVAHPPVRTPCGSFHSCTTLP